MIREYSVLPFTTNKMGLSMSYYLINGATLDIVGPYSLWTATVQAWMLAGDWRMFPEHELHYYTTLGE